MHEKNYEYKMESMDERVKSWILVYSNRDAGTQQYPDKARQLRTHGMLYLHEDVGPNHSS